VRAPARMMRRAAAELSVMRRDELAACYWEPFYGCRAVLAILVSWLAPAHMVFGQSPALSDTRSREVQLYVTHFEADGMRFESLEDLRTYLLSAPNDFFALTIRDCAASDRVQELMRIMLEVLSKRFVGRGAPQAYEFGVSSPPQCPWPSQ